MKEQRFVKQNRDKWVKFEKLLDVDYKDPDRLSTFFIEITDDLSYARTFYNNRSIRVYLNNLCQQLFYTIYRSRKTNLTIGFKKFWIVELPLITYQCRRELLTSLLIFLLACAIGVVSSMHDTEFVSVILGDRYVEMTTENIQKGDPMAVYKDMNQVDMFLGITYNNLFVAVKTFLLGILYAIGSIIILISNGIMVGAFQYFFIERGLFQDSFLTIWLHGTLEISSIVIAGGAGIVLGMGLIAPGTYTRLQSFQLAAKRGVKLLLGILPILTFAAIIESFLTRYTEVPDIIRLVLILVSFAFIIFYFVWYPRVVNSKYPQGEGLTDQLQTSPSFSISYQGIIKSVNEILKDTFLFYRKYSSKLLGLSFMGTLIYLPGVLFLIYSSLYTLDFSVNGWYFDKMTGFIDYQQYPELYLINSFALTIVAVIVLTLVKKDSASTQPGEKRNKFIETLNICVLFFIPQATFFMNGGISILLFLALFPFFIFASYVLIEEGLNFPGAMKRSVHLIGSSSGKFIRLYFLTAVIAALAYLFMNSPFPLFYLEFIKWNLPVEDESLTLIMVSLNASIAVLSLLVVLPLFLISHGMLYFSLKETLQAEGLMASLEKFGK